jgi:hypothetical protein
MTRRSRQDSAWSLVLRALAEMGGFERGVLYDVPREDAPRSLTSTRVFVKGTPGWRRFLAARSQLDDGILTLMLALRTLNDDERRLAVDWGCRFANAFLLVEPNDASCDLTDPANDVRCALETTALMLLNDRHADTNLDQPWTRRTPLGASLRRLFGVWITWPEPFTDTAPDRVPLRLHDTDVTLRHMLMRTLAERHPQERFDAALADLYERERELFGGPVARTRIPFLTRLGMPVLYDPRSVDRAVRRLVNEGRAWVFEEGPDPTLYRGPQRPLPERMTDAEIERLVMR